MGVWSSTIDMSVDEMQSILVQLIGHPVHS